MNQFEDDFNEEDRSGPPAKRKGGFLYPDDFKVGQFVAIHSVKEDPNRSFPFLGIPVEIKAIQRPFLAAVPVGHDQATVMDTRQFNLIEANMDFVKAMTPPKRSPSHVGGKGGNLMAMLQQAIEGGDMPPDEPNGE